MRSLFIILAVLVVFSGCVKKNKVPTAQNAIANPSMHEVKVAEVIQTSQYTYLKVSENGVETWIAVTRMEAAAGETYYYDTAMEMTNFKSKELNRTFESILFVQEISKQPVASTAAMQPSEMPGAATHTGKIPDGKKEGISVTPAQGSVSIADLFKNRSNYAGKVIKVKGQVVKINEQVIGKNWIHIQDGSGSTDDFDLTITTLDGCKMDEVVTCEGTISLKKDFTHGYFYEVIMEDAKLIK
jgi:starvation-inducible outer membrane lipoprotein